MLEKLENIIKEYTGDDSITINENTFLVADLGFNSLDLVNLACNVEDVFEIEIPDRAIRDFKTIGDVTAFIEKNI